MALTQITFCLVGAVVYSGLLPAADGESAVSEDITPSGTNQQSAAATKGYARVATDTTVYVALGANPDATVSTGRFLLPANSVEYFQIEVGNKVAVVTAA